MKPSEIKRLNNEFAIQNSLLHEDELYALVAQNEESLQIWKEISYTPLGQLLTKKNKDPFVTFYLLD